MLLLYVHSENIMYHLHVPMKENPQLSLSFMHTSDLEEPKPCTSDDNYTQVSKNHQLLKEIPDKIFSFLYTATSSSSTCGSGAISRKDLLKDEEASPPLICDRTEPLPSSIRPDGDMTS